MNKRGSSCCEEVCSIVSSCLSNVTADIKFHSKVVSDEVCGTVESYTDCERLSALAGCDNGAVVPLDIDFNIDVVNDFNIDLLNIVSWVDILVGVGLDLNNVNTSSRSPCSISTTVL